MSDSNGLTRDLMRAFNVSFQVTLSVGHAIVEVWEDSSILFSQSHSLGYRIHNNNIHDDHFMTIISWIYGFRFLKLDDCR